MPKLSQQAYSPGEREGESSSGGGAGISSSPGGARIPSTPGSAGIPVILVYDIGKTNKKLLVFDGHYNIVYDEGRRIPEIKDEDLFPSDDIVAISDWVKESFERIRVNEKYDLRAVNFSAYGASFVYLDEQLKITAPLYNYLKPFPNDIAEPFYKKYGGEENFSLATSSPVLGSLNSGLQLYRISRENPGLFKRIKYALHLPQYLSFLITGSLHSELTSIGCHTALWDFQKGFYHEWVTEEALEPKFPPIKKATDVIRLQESIIAGAGMHDSSAALIPVLKLFNEPFVLLSTGTWCIALNPFNQQPLTPEELRQDCLCYLSGDGKPVKASRLMAGYEHEEQTARLASHFNLAAGFYNSLEFDPALAKAVDKNSLPYHEETVVRTGFAKRSLNSFTNYESAYYQLVQDIVQLQVKSLDLVIQGTGVKNILVDGNFAGNDIFMQLLAHSLEDHDIYATGISNASALGAAMVIHDAWNSNPIPGSLVQIRKISSQLPSKK